MFKSYKAISSKSNQKQMGPGCMIVFFSLFLLAGLGFLWLNAIGPALRIQAAKDWPSVPCRILSSEVKRHSGDDGSTYSILIKYEYQYKGKQYTSDRYSFFTGSSSGREGKAKIVAQHPHEKKYKSPAVKP